MTFRSADSIGLPVRAFMYTVDQIATLMEVTERTVYDNYLFYQGRSVGARPKDKMWAVDISPSTAEKPDWRVSERELIRWFRYKGFRYHQRGYIS